MLQSLRQASRLLAAQPGALARMFSSQSGALSGLLPQQPPSLASLFGLQPAGAPAAAAAPLPASAAAAGLLPPAAAAALPLSLQQQQLAVPTLLPELADILGVLEGARIEDSGDLLHDERLPAGLPVLLLQPSSAFGSPC